MEDSWREREIRGEAAVKSEEKTNTTGDGEEAHDGEGGGKRSETELKRRRALIKCNIMKAIKSD